VLKRKLLSFILILTLMLTLVACGSKKVEKEALLVTETTDVVKEEVIETNVREELVETNVIEVKTEDREDIKLKEEVESKEKRKVIVVKEYTEEVKLTDKTKVVEETKKISAKEIKIADKIKALTLAGSKLSGAQMNKLVSMSKDGFTAKEKAKAKTMFYENFTAEEQVWIMKIYEKYN